MARFRAILPEKVGLASFGPPYGLRTPAAGASLRLCPSHRLALKSSATRGGYTLVELMVVISINSVLMAVAVGLLGTLVRSGQTAQRHWTQTATSVRLAAQFRDDVAASQQAKIVQDAVADGSRPPANARRTTLKLFGPADRVVEFHRDAEHVRRVESRGTTVTRNEVYAIPKLAATVFGVPADGSNDEDDPSSSKFVTMMVQLASGPGADGEAWQIVARLAKDLRFAAGDRAQGEDEP